MGAVIALSNLTVSYQRHPALHHISGRLEEGSLTAITGPNGSGKSTLLKAIKQLVRPDSGHIDYIGTTPADIAYMPQYHHLDLHFPITVMELVLLGFWRSTGLFRRIDHDCYHKASAALAEVGLEGFENRRINTLSVGQLQRVLFARVMVQDARIILLDEPFSAVDSASTTVLLSILRRWHEEGRTVMAVVHHLELVKQHFPGSIMLARELIGWGETAAVLNEANLAKAQRMVAAWDEHAPACEVAV